MFQLFSLEYIEVAYLKNRLIHISDTTKFILIYVIIYQHLCYAITSASYGGSVPAEAEKFFISVGHPLAS